MKKIFFKLTVLLMLVCPFLVKGLCVDSDDPATNKGLNIKTTPGSTVSVLDWRMPNTNSTPLNHYTMLIPNTASLQTETVTRLNPYFWLQGNINTLHLQSQPPNEKDYDPAKGWELMTHYFGGTYDPVSAPYVILYNRYQGTLRVFFYIRPGIGFSYNAGRIDIKFIYNQEYHTGNIQKESALLAYAKTPIKALDKFDKNLVSSSPIIVNSEGNFWLYADFPMAYDACTCNYISQLSIRPVLFQVAKVELTQDDISKTTVTSSSSSSPSVSPVISGYKKDFDTFVGKLTGVGKSLKAGIDAVEGLIPSKVIYETITKTDLNEVPGIDELTYIQKIKTDKRTPFKFPQEIKEAAGTFGLAFGLIELMIGGGESTTPAISAKGLKYRISGIISTEFPLTPAVLFTPGSNWPSNTGATLSKPVYNNTLGIFNMTETPRINFNTVGVTSEGSPYNYQTVSGNSVQSTQYNYVKWDFKLLDDIKYSINPASGYKPVPVDIKAALVFSVNAKCLNDSRVPGQKFPPFCTFSSPISSSCTVVRAKNPDGKLSDTAVITTPLMPLSCIKEYVAHLAFVGNSAFKTTAIPSNSNAPFKDDVRLLIMANLERVDDPTKQLLFTAQYQLFPEVTNTLIPNTPISNIRLNPIFENLNLTNDLTIRAWETVTFKGTVTTNGFRLTVIAGREVKFENSANIPPNADISIGLPTECQGATPQPQTPAQLYAFCAKAGVKKYNPDAPAPLVSDIPTDKIRSSFGFNISPNPFFSQVAVDFNLESETLTTLDISNALGQTIRSLNLGIKDKGSYQEIIQTADLAAGIYFLTLRTKNGIETKKIVKRGE
jgi:hypothetical protein